MTVLEKMEQARLEERERCIDILLASASDALADAVRWPFRFAYAEARYEAAWLLMLYFDWDVAHAWPSPGRWADWAREACSTEAAS